MRIDEVYSINELIGEGAFGQVFLGVHEATGEKRAIKRLKGSVSWENTIPLRELQVLSELSRHPNIVLLHEVYWEEVGNVYFVFEYIQNGSLHDLLEKRLRYNKPLKESDIREIIQQILRGLQHMHSHRCIHRDIKPENILLQGEIVKVADFTMARGPSRQSPMTSYVSTRWYRAPEMLLGLGYSHPVDIFGVGCIVSELLSLTPLFPGQSEMDQFGCLLGALGWPKTWPQGVAKLDQLQITSTAIKTPSSSSLEKVHPNASLQVLDFAKIMLRWNPAQRATAQESLGHAFLTKSTQVTTTATMSLSSYKSRVVSPTPARPVVNPYKVNQE